MKHGRSVFNYPGSRVNTVAVDASYRNKVKLSSADAFEEVEVYKTLVRRLRRLQVFWSGSRPVGRTVALHD